MNEKEYVLADYQFHPRILELRFSVIYDSLVRIFGLAVGGKVMESTCKGLGADMDEIKKLMKEYPNIMRLKRMNIREFNTQVYIMGRAWNENEVYISRVYLGKHQISYDDRQNAKRIYTEAYHDKLMRLVKVTHSDYQINNLSNLLVDMNFIKLAFS